MLTWASPQAFSYNEILFEDFHLSRSMSIYVRTRPSVDQHLSTLLSSKQWSVFRRFPCKGQGLFVLEALEDCS